MSLITKIKKHILVSKNGYQKNLHRFVEKLTSFGGKSLHDTVFLTSIANLRLIQWNITEIHKISGQIVNILRV